ncbi:2',3'-cyclic-nucleotide 3'-phosphodiesterase-like [Bacillus rossius redtenbacheri]|uniref:2',3'-cyclic-nucleotide 3'-phosphodiesterase-like n=1 Tax=Bacillus rossius redtenbacheri TaxID=93214 RepID=UPI002FDCC11F
MGQATSILDRVEPVPVNITSTKFYSHAQNVKVLNPEYLQYPFIDDKGTVEYVFGSRVIFILRGLPGSGKSTVARAIKGTYPGSVLCSADDLFLQSNRCEPSRDQLHEAQVWCQQKARRACEDGASVVVVDSANVRRWELEYYLQLAVENSYVAVVVEPSTPWKWDPEQLVRRNTHRVPLEVLLARVEMWDAVVPLYFGWFLNAADSRVLGLVGRAHLEECFRVPQFADDFQSFSRLSEVQDMLQYYALPPTCPKGMLHCTSKFCLGGKVPGSVDYARKEEVFSNCGRSYQLCIVGFLMTPRTFGARVKLDEEALALWANDQEGPRKTGSPGPSPARTSLPFDPSNPGSTSVAQDYEPLPSPKGIVKKKRHHKPPCRATLVTFKKFEPSFHPTSGSGSQAHVTLGCAEGVSAVTTGYDLNEIIACEDSDEAESVETYTLDRGYLRNYGESRWMLYLNHQIVVSTLFTGHYGSS